MRTAHDWWPNVAIPNSQDLGLPSNFEDGAGNVDPEDVAEQIACGPDPERHLELIRKFEQAGFDHVYVHQVGPDQDGFFRFYREQIFPRL
jgi:coenzyme F420-dependent glucose-6-phosphate dehydrogenase